MNSLESLILSHNLTAHAAVVRALVRPCVKLQAARIEQTRLASWDSRLGGLPHGPQGALWPQWKSAPMDHLVSINCAEAAACDATGTLPRGGMLQFWYASHSGEWGFDPNDAGAYRVEYLPPGTPLEIMTPPRKAHVHPACAVTFTSGVSLPDWEWLEMHSPQHRALGELDDYRALELALRSVGGPHQMLGYANSVQGPMELQCQLVTHGLYCGNATGYEDPRRKELEKDMLDWRLLLQLDTDEAGPGWMWGDCGTLFYWIRTQALAQRQTQQCWGILQCC